MDENVVTNNLEEQPLSQLKSSSVFDVPETVAPAESDDSGAPLGQRLSSSKPPTRRDALKELAQLFASGDTACFDEFGAKLKPALEDKASLSITDIDSDAIPGLFLLASFLLLH